MMKRTLILVLSLLMLVLCIPALAESTDWNYDANYAILRGRRSWTAFTSEWLQRAPSEGQGTIIAEQAT